MTAPSDFLDVEEDGGARRREENWDEPQADEELGGDRVVNWDREQSEHLAQRLGRVRCPECGGLFCEGCKEV